MINLSLIRATASLPPTKALKALRTLYRTARRSRDDDGAEAALHVAIAIAVDSALPARGFARAFVWLLRRGATVETRVKIRRVSRSTRVGLVTNELRRTVPKEPPPMTEDLANAIATAEQEQ